MRSPTYVQLATNTTSDILPLDYIQLAFGVGIGLIPSQDAAGPPSASVLLTFDDLSSDAFGYCTISQTTTVITVTDPGLAVRGGVAVGDVVKIRGSGVASGVDGTYAVATAPSPTTYTVTSGVSQSATGGVNSQHAYYRMFAAPAALTAQVARASGFLSHSTTGPVTGIALKLTGRTVGSVTMAVVQGAGP
jgi:hypothetical protein